MNKSSRNKTFKLALLGIFSAIVALQNMVPFLGYFPIPPFNPTIIQVTVIIIAVVMGPLEGGILGLVWGVFCIIRALTAPLSPMDTLVFTNPLVAVLPRIAVGVAAGYICSLMKRLSSRTKFRDITSYAVSGFIGSFINTVLVLSMMYLLYRNNKNVFDMDLSAILPALLGIAGTNGIAEAVTSAIIVPLVAKPLSIYKSRMS